MAEFLKVLRFQEARQKIREHFPHRGQEKVCLTEAQGRVLAEDVISSEDLPAFHRTVVDGYAVLAEDTFGSNESLPAYLDYVGEITIGQEAGLSLRKGQCCWIPTGGMLPEGSDAAVMVEYTEKLGEDSVLIYQAVGPWENVMQKGEDIKKGEIVFSAGSFLRAQDIGLLASLGINEILLSKPWKVGLISTGDEVIPIEENPEIGQVRDVNSHALAAAVRDCGAIPYNYPLVRDEFTLLKNAVETGLRENDLLIMSGGSSVGLMDVTLDVLLSFPGAEMLFHGIAVKPGKPTLAVRIGDKMVIGLPGHPVSALMMFHIICADALSPYPSLSVDANLGLNLSSQAGRDDFVAVELREEKGEKLAYPLLGKSGLMNILSRADGFVHIPYEKQGLLKGEKIKVYLY